MHPALWIWAAERQGRGWESLGPPPEHPAPEVSLWPWFNLPWFSTGKLTWKWLFWKGIFKVDFAPTRQIINFSSSHKIETVAGSKPRTPGLNWINSVFHPCEGSFQTITFSKGCPSWREHKRPLRGRSQTQDCGTQIGPEWKMGHSPKGTKHFLFPTLQSSIWKHLHTTLSPPKQRMQPVPWAPGRGAHLALYPCATHLLLSSRGMDALASLPRTTACPSPPLRPRLLQSSLALAPWFWLHSCPLYVCICTPRFLKRNVFHQLQVKTLSCAEEVRMVSDGSHSPKLNELK